ncbi:CBS domain-containing protein [Ignatzschineria rhizosphaerae]|uniref:CBS domain-containing protein n=1 Tax=Ignatzschineria rhizosphaerae TaxID=2923279 RepID=A0ABY3X5F6_9GAMM|nr:transporter associated domain-containing protein [Ignatzschineria rhizosphaerae]UNM96015.1 CBS domain-containing protein [Ignatzschineria rhizosphaerae]
MAEEGSRKGESWLQRLGFDKNRDISVERLIQDCEAARVEGLISDDAAEMVRAIIAGSDQIVRDIMVPRAKMITIAIDDQPEEILKRIIESGHSRFPVLSENHEEIMGVLLSKDLLPYVGAKTLDIKSLIRPVEYVPEGKFVTALINDFRNKRTHLALVVDEYGSVSGLITIEDLLEQIVGDIDDEHDRAEEPKELVKVVGENLFVINALIPLEEFNTYFKRDFDEEDVETLSGLIMKNAGSLPAENDVVEIEDMCFKILPFTGNYINSVELSFKEVA